MDDFDHQVELEAYRTAREARNLEVNLFWQRSNYFLVLSTAIGAAFFSLKGLTYSITLASFGVVVGFLWLATNLGSKFWQSRWERRLQVVEMKLRADMNLHSASWETVQSDVLESFSFRNRGRLHSAYKKLVLLKPSVTMVMTGLSCAFVVFWVAVILVTVRRIYGYAG